MEHVLDDSLISKESTPVEYAGYMRRVGAAFVDGILLSVLFIIITSLLGSGESFLDKFRYLSTGANPLVSIIYLVICFAYYAGMEASSKQATPGKLALSIKVVDEAGERITVISSFKRTFLKCIYNVISLIAPTVYALTGIFSLYTLVDYLFPLWDRKKQSIHDKFAATYVVMNK